MKSTGFETKPDVPLGTYLKLRAQNAKQGVDYTQLINVNLSGPANGRSPMYNWDKTNFQPRVGVAWSPDFASGLLSRIFGKESQSVLRGGFGINGDYFGQALATFFDVRNTLGFGSSFTTGPNTYDVGCSPYQDPARDTTEPAWACCGGVNLGPLLPVLVKRSAVCCRPLRSCNPFHFHNSSRQTIHSELSLRWIRTSPHPRAIRGALPLNASCPRVPCSRLATRACWTSSAGTTRHHAADRFG